jgi:2-methylcitrate dehydratase
MLNRGLRALRRIRPIVSPTVVKMDCASYSAAAPVLNVRPESDAVIQDISNYVHSPLKAESALARETARLCLIDTLGCGLEALRFSQCTKLLGPIVEGSLGGLLAN